MAARREPVLAWAVAAVGLALAVLDAVAAGLASSTGWTAYFAVVAAVALVLGLAGLAHTELGRYVRLPGSSEALAWRVGSGPVGARKAAILSFDGDRVGFLSQQERASYGTVAVARCEGPVLTEPVSFPQRGAQLHRLLARLLEEFPHAAPLDRCTCGFYGRVGHVEVPGPNEVLLDVELSGRVLARGDSRRAETQQVLAIAIPRQCAAAKSDGSSDVMHETRERCGAEAVAIRVAADRLVPVCEMHSGGLLLSPLDVGRHAGVPASWLEDGIVSGV